MMTTGMSAPPIDAVMWRPKAPERPVAAPRHAKPVAGDGFAMKSAPAPNGLHLRQRISSERTDAAHEIAVLKRGSCVTDNVVGVATGSVAAADHAAVHCAYDWEE